MKEGNNKARKQFRKSRKTGRKEGSQQEWKNQSERKDGIYNARKTVRKGKEVTKEKNSR